MSSPFRTLPLDIIDNRRDTVSVHEQTAHAMHADETPAQSKARLPFSAMAALLETRDWLRSSSADLSAKVEDALVVQHALLERRRRLLDERRHRLARTRALLASCKGEIDRPLVRRLATLLDR